MHFKASFAVLNVRFIESVLDSVRDDSYRRFGNDLRFCINGCFLSGLWRWNVVQITLKSSLLTMFGIHSEVFICKAKPQNSIHNQAIREKLGSMPLCCLDLVHLTFIVYCN